MRRFHRLLLMAVVAIGLSGCASRNVALVLDSQDETPQVWDVLSHYVSKDKLGADDRLLLIGISSENALRFRNEIEFRQYPRGPKGRSNVRVFASGDRNDYLLLVNFKHDAGPTAYIQPFPCHGNPKMGCIFSRSAEEHHLQIDLPAPGQVSYAGHLQYVIEDRFPDRGTRNHPVVKQLLVVDDYQRATQAALEKWPFLSGSNIAKSLGVVAAGRAPVFVFGSKEFKE